VDSQNILFEKLEKELSKSSVNPEVGLILDSLRVYLWNLNYQLRSSTNSKERIEASFKLMEQIIDVSIPY
jgi:hypothetical protein